MDKQSLMDALISCGGADGIDHAKIVKHMKLQARLEFEKKLAEK